MGKGTFARRLSEAVEVKGRYCPSRLVAFTRVRNHRDGKRDVYSLLLLLLLLLLLKFFISIIRLIYPFIQFESFLLV